MELDKVNTISAHMLSAIVPGIGRVLSNRIVDERNRNGPFTSFEDLRSRVYGLGLEKHTDTERDNIFRAPANRMSRL